MFTIRNATLQDAPRILEIYAYYVEKTAISFEHTVPTLEAFRTRMETTLQRYPYLVIERDGVVEGYAYASPFIGREAYDWSCQTTIYLSAAAKKYGMGRKIYTALEEALQRMGILNVYACIGYPEEEDEYLTRNSAQFHAHMGYKKVGEFRHCGYKFDRWYHMIWMEKIIGTHGQNQPKPVNYPDVG